MNVRTLFDAQVILRHGLKPLKHHQTGAKGESFIPIRKKRWRRQPGLQIISARACGDPLDQGYLGWRSTSLYKSALENGTRDAKNIRTYLESVVYQSHMYKAYSISAWSPHSGWVWRNGVGGSCVRCGSWLLPDSLGSSLRAVSSTVSRQTGRYC